MSEQDKLGEYLSFAKDVAKDSGKIMRKHFSPVVSQREKSDKTIVTIADEEINNLVIKRVAEVFPEHAVIGEEKSTAKKSEDSWVCDPIDGTFLYAIGIPLAVFSLALVRDGEPVVGVVNDPFQKILYTAMKGQGAYMNDKPIQVSDKPLSYRAALNIEDWPDSEINLYGVRELSEHESGLDFYSIGTTVHVACLVARGSFEATLFAGTKRKCVDIAAVKVIVEEAGGKVTDINGNEQRYDGDINGAVISNGVVHQELLDLIKRGLSNNSG